MFSLGRGLTFRRREKAPVLLFDFGERVRFALTALFVFFPFYVVWLDGERVVQVKRVKPFTFHIGSAKSYTRIVEIPVSARYRRQIALLDGEEERFKNTRALSKAMTLAERRSI